MATDHIFTGCFESRDAACDYTEPLWLWESEPDENATDEEYYAWEDRNPHWPMKADLGVFLDSDFVETIGKDEGLQYLRSMLKDQSAAERICQKVPVNHNVLVIISSYALFDESVTLASTPRLIYWGRFEIKS